MNNIYKKMSNIFLEVGDVIKKVPITSPKVQTIQAKVPITPAKVPVTPAKVPRIITEEIQEIINKINNLSRDYSNVVLTSIQEDIENIDNNSFKQELRQQLNEKLKSFSSTQGGFKSKKKLRSLKTNYVNPVTGVRTRKVKVRSLPKYRKTYKRITY